MPAWRPGVLLLLAPGGVHASPEAVPGALWQAMGLARPVSRVPAPPFSAPDLAGRPITLAGLQGRVGLLYFWATW